MQLTKKTIIAVDLMNEPKEVLNALKKLDFLNHSEVHFVHVFKTINYSFVFSEFPMVYPIEADRKVIEESVLSMLRKTTKEVLPANFQGKVIERCLFSDNAKAKFCEYVAESKGDLAVVLAREKHDLFESSFARYVSSHSKANILILKHK